MIYQARPSSPADLNGSWRSSVMISDIRRSSPESDISRRISIEFDESQWRSAEVNTARICKNQCGRHKVKNCYWCLINRSSWFTMVEFFHGANFLLQGPQAALAPKGGHFKAYVCFDCQVMKVFLCLSKCCHTRIAH